MFYSGPCLSSLSQTTGCPNNILLLKKLLLFLKTSISWHSFTKLCQCHWSKENIHSKEGGKWGTGTFVIHKTNDFLQLFFQVNSDYHDIKSCLWSNIICKGLNNLYIWFTLYLENKEFGWFVICYRKFTSLDWANCLQSDPGNQCWPGRGANVAW